MGDSLPTGLSDFDPTMLPWEALKVSLSQSFFGSRIDNDFDQEILDSFIDSVFQPKSFTSAAPLAFRHTNEGTGVALVSLPADVSKEVPENITNSLTLIFANQILFERL